MEKTKVIFRKYKDNGDIVALFPELPGTYHPFTCMSYQHVWQHGLALLPGISDYTTLANPPEYVNLKTELESIGYNLQVVKRISQKMDSTRQARIR